MAAEALIKAYGKMDQASFSQLVFSAAIMTDKARLLAGESTGGWILTASPNQHRPSRGQCRATFYRRSAAARLGPTE